MIIYICFQTPVPAPMFINAMHAPSQNQLQPNTFVKPLKKCEYTVKTEVDVKSSIPPSILSVPPPICTNSHNANGSNIHIPSLMHHTPGIPATISTHHIPISDVPDTQDGMVPHRAVDKELVKKEIKVKSKV